MKFLKLNSRKWMNTEKMHLTTGQTMLEADNDQYHTQVIARKRFSRQIKRGAKLQ